MSIAFAFGLGPAATESGIEERWRPWATKETRRCCSSESISLKQHRRDVLGSVERTRVELFS